jgi:hypothetical protein
MFHPISLIIPFMVLLPALILIKTPPRNTPAGKSGGSALHAAAETAGRLGSFIIPLFFAIRVNEPYEILSLAGMIVSLGFYYSGWIRYWTKGREYKLLFSPMLGIPVPLAVSPCVYFGFSSVVLHSPVFFICGVIFAWGHITSSMLTYRSL